MLDVVELGELAAVVGGDVLLELFERLAPQVGAVHQEEHAPGAAELDEPVDAADGGVGLAAAGGHLDQRAGMVGGQRLLEVGDGLDLAVAQANGVQGRQAAQAGAQGHVAVGRVGSAGGDLGEPLGERLGAVKGEDGATARLGIELAGEARLDAGGLIGEGQGIAGGAHAFGQSATVFGALLFDAGEGGADLLGLDGADGLAIDEEQVVGGAGGERELADGDAASRAEVEPGAVLHHPAGLRELGVDPLAGLVLGLHRCRSPGGASGTLPRHCRGAQAGGRARRVGGAAIVQASKAQRRSTPGRKYRWQGYM